MTFNAEDFAPREARVDYPENWPWPDKPWPWCSKAERQVYAVPGSITDGLRTIEAVPHDAHVTNEGNTHCPGVPGLVPAKFTREDLKRGIYDQEHRVDRAERLARDEQRQLDKLLAISAELHKNRKADS